MKYLKSIVMTGFIAISGCGSGYWNGSGAGEEFTSYGDDKTSGGDFSAGGSENGPTTAVKPSGMGSSVDGGISVSGASNGGTDGMAGMPSDGGSDGTGGSVNGSSGSSGDAGSTGNGGTDGNGGSDGTGGSTAGSGGSSNPGGTTGNGGSNGGMGGSSGGAGGSAGGAGNSNGGTGGSTGGTSGSGGSGGAPLTPEQIYVRDFPALACKKFHPDTCFDNEAAAVNFFRCLVTRWSLTNYEPSTVSFCYQPSQEPSIAEGCATWITDHLKEAAGKETFGVPKNWTAAETAQKTVTTCGG